MNGYILEAQSILQVGGRDARDFLHRLLSCNIFKLQSGQVMPGTLLKANGKLVAYFHAYAQPSGVALVTPTACFADLLATLDRLVFTEDIQLEPQPDTQIFTVVGPQAAALFGLEVGQQQEHRLGDGTVRVGALAPDQFQVWVPGADAPNAEAALQAQGIQPLSAQDYAAYRIQQGLPAWDAELDSSVVPLGLRLERAFDHHKGCYTGQEVVSNMTYVTHPPHRLLGLKLAGTVAPGSKAHLGDATVGTVTTSTPGLALMRARWERVQPGDTVTLESEGQTLSAEVVDLPMV